MRRAQVRNNMRIFNAYHISRIHTLPFRSIKQLLTEPMPSLFSTSYRDYMEWNNLSIARRGKFFDPHINDPLPGMYPTLHMGSLVSHSLARWMHVDYKLNSYPYNDLNIMIIYNDFTQASSMAKLLVDYLEHVDVQHEGRISCYLVPLYNLPNLSTSKKKQANTHRRIHSLDKGIFLSDADKYFTEDPIYVLLLDDVMKHLSCDLVRLSDKNEWQQLHVSIDNVRAERCPQYTDMDYWSRVSQELFIPKNLNFRAGSEAYVPTRFTELLYFLTNSIADHRLVTIGPGHNRSWWYPFLATKHKQTLERIQACQVYDIFKKSEVETLFVWDFMELKSLYNSVNGGLKRIQTNRLSTFSEEWMDLKESEALLKTDLSREYALLKESKLAFLCSTG